MRRIVDELMDYVLELKQYAKENRSGEQPLYERGQYLSCLEKWAVARGTERDLEFFKSVTTNQHKNRVLIRYDLRAMGQDMWNDDSSIYRECRSVVINVETEEIVILPFQKFFNVNEVPENEEEVLKKEIAKAGFFEVAEKLDGSLQNISMDQGKLILAGSQSLDPEQSWRVKLGYSLVTDEIRQMVQHNPGFTFSFEMIHQDNPHVVHYTEEENGLYLLGIREISTGIQHRFETVIRTARSYGVATIRTENKSLDEMLSEMGDHKGDEKEGWVMNIDGRLVKLKCDNYVFLHKAIGGMTSPKAIIQSVVDGNSDDFYSKLPESLQAQVRTIMKRCTMYQHVMDNKVNEAYCSIKKDDQKLKDFMIAAQELPCNVRQHVIRKRVGNEYDVLKDKKYDVIVDTLIEEGIIDEE